MDESFPFLDLIPHRSPFLFVDEVLELEENHAVTKLHLREDLECFKGHYPGAPVFPGVLSLETILQCGAILASNRMKEMDSMEGKVPVVTRINEVKFKSVLKPGDQLEAHSQIDEYVSGVFFMRGWIIKDGKKAVMMKFASTLIDRE